MEKSLKDQNKTPKEDDIIVEDEEVEQLKKNLPKVYTPGRMSQLIQYQGFWCNEHILKNVLTFQRHFRARDSDLIIASYPKTGNTWLKALLFAIVNRQSQNQSLLLKKHPHELVFFLENDIYGKAFEYPGPEHLDQLPSPRLFHTHLPYHALPESIRTSNCRILCLSRNPLDTFVSANYFATSAMKKARGDDYCKFHLPTLEEQLEQCLFQGQSNYGPFFDHVVGYWKQSLEQPNKMMFILYEDLKEDPEAQVIRIAEFTGFPFSTQEESKGIIEEIVKLCSFNSLKELEVNKTGVINKIFEKKSYFRKGEVGDWTKHFTPPMVERMKKFVEDKFSGTGLSFKFSSS